MEGFLGRVAFPLGVRGFEYFSSEDFDLSLELEH